MFSDSPNRLSGCWLAAFPESVGRERRRPTGCGWSSTAEAGATPDSLVRLTPSKPSPRQSPYAVWR